MLSAFVNSFKIPELRQRILFTLGMIFASRFLAAVPVPGVDVAAVQSWILSQENTGSWVGLFNLFSGGALENFAVGTLGIMPYISASIILQLMTAVIPALERLAREGDTGRQKITQYTRYLTVGLCLVQGFATAMALRGGGGENAPFVRVGGGMFIVLAVITLTTGTMLLMWLGEQITARGVGNGISMIITVGIVSRLPAAVRTVIQRFQPVAEGGASSLTVFHLVFMAVMLFLVVAGVVAITQAQRKIPVQYAKRVVGRKVYGGQSTYMPLRVNYAGVMPIIFAQSILMIPARLFQWIGKAADSRFWMNLGASVDYGSTGYTILYALMILFFSYFWVATQFNPVQIADDLKKYGGYVPGIRPGKPTAEFLDRAMTRITLAGAIFLTVIAVLPQTIGQMMNLPWIVSSFFGGTSLLIMVGVVLDTMRQIESHLLTRHYDGFLKKGRLRGRR